MRPGIEHVRSTLLKEIRETPATRDYLRRIDTRVAADLERQSDETGLVLPPGEGAPFDRAELMAWDAGKRRRLARDGPWQWYYELGRRSAEALGRFAFAYRSPLSRFYRDPLLLDRVRRGLATYREHLSPGGEFVFCPVRYADVFGPHEQAWRLEPLIYAYVWIEDELPERERRAAWEMFERAAECLYRRRRPGETNNRGAVWCAVMALAGCLLGKDEYLDAARASWEEVRSILSPDGQVLEGGGPDDNYSFTAMSYIYLYRVWSGDASLDESMIAALKWFARWHNRSGYAFGGMATRKRRPIRLGLADLIAPLERYARVEPFFRNLASTYLAFLDRHSPGTGGGHGCSPFIWATLEHEPGEPAASEPSWVSEFVEEYRAPAVRYALVRRAFQTAVTLRAPQGLNGLQTWAWGGEPPIVAPGRAKGSATRGWGLDTALLPVSTYPDAANRERVVWRRSEPVCLSFRQGWLWTHILFGKVTTLVMFEGPETPRVTTWCCNLALAPEPVVGHGVVAFLGLEGQLHFVGGPPSVRRAGARGDGKGGPGQAGEDPLVLLDFEAPRGGLVPFAFSDSSFAWGEMDLSRGVVSFRDRAGSVQVELCRAPGRPSEAPSNQGDELLRVEQREWREPGCVRSLSTTASTVSASASTPT